MTRSRILRQEMKSLAALPDDYFHTDAAIEDALAQCARDEAARLRQQQRTEAADAWAGREPDPNPNWTI